MTMKLVGLLKGVLIVAVACASYQASPIQMTPSLAVIATQMATQIASSMVTATFSAISKPTSSSTFRARPTPTLTPVPRKPVLVSYRVTSGDIGDETYSCLLWRDSYSFVLYEDGQVILLGENGLSETVLSQTDIDSLLQQIDHTGFFQVEGTGELREKDPIYDVPTSLQVGDGAGYEEISVKRKTVSVYFPLMEYAIEPVKQTLELIRGYRPNDLKPYAPQRLWLWIFNITGKDLDWQIATPVPPVEVWPSELPSLLVLEELTDNNYAVIEGESITPTAKLFSRYPSMRIFKEGAMEYLVMACPLLP
jgi:hypothetical protein